MTKLWAVFRAETSVLKRARGPLTQPLYHTVRCTHFPQVAIDARLISQLGEDEASFLVAGEIWRDFEDVVEAIPDAVCFLAHGVGEHFDEEEEGGVPLLHGANVPGPGGEGG